MEDKLVFIIEKAVKQGESINSINEKAVKQGENIDSINEKAVKQGESIDSINERLNDQNAIVKAKNEVTTKTKKMMIQVKQYQMYWIDCLSLMKQYMKSLFLNSIVIYSKRLKFCEEIIIHRLKDNITNQTANTNSFFGDLGISTSTTVDYNEYIQMDAKVNMKSCKVTMPTPDGGFAPELTQPLWELYLKGFQIK